MSGLEIEKIGDLAREVVLTLGDLTVRQHQAPHDFGQDHLLPCVVVLTKLGGKPIVINGVPPFFFGQP